MFLFCILFLKYTPPPLFFSSLLCSLMFATTQSSAPLPLDLRYTSRPFIFTLYSLL